MQPRIEFGHDYNSRSANDSLIESKKGNFVLSALEIGPVQRLNQLPSLEFIFSKLVHREHYDEFLNSYPCLERRRH